MDFVRFHDLGLIERFGKMERLPLLTLSTLVYMTLVRLFYYEAKLYEIGAMMNIKISLIMIEYEINGDMICEILGIPTIGECVYETKMWPRLEGCTPSQAVQRLCGLGDASSFIKLNAIELTMTSHILQNIASHCIF